VRHTRRGVPLRRGGPLSAGVGEFTRARCVCRLARGLSTRHAAIVRLNCDEPRVGAALQTWLDDSRLAPPATLTLDVQVRDTLPDQKLGPVVFRQPTVEMRVGPPPLGVRLSWDIAPAIATVAPGEMTAKVVLSRSAVARMDECVRSFLLTVLIFLLRRSGWHHIHAAAAADPAGRGWLLVGDTRSGKSTTVALLGALGWPVVTDDVGFLAGTGKRTQVIGFRAPIALRDDVFASVCRNGGTYLPKRKKTAYWPEELGASWMPRLEPEVLLFTSIGDSVTRVEPIGAGEALSQLVSCSAWVALEPELAQVHLDLITCLARQARRYRVILGKDLFAKPNHLAELVQ
jgi:hypothetical protein